MRLDGARGERPYDVVFLSYDEPWANALFHRVEAVFGPAKRLHGVTGMRRAYQLCAHIVESDQFLLADGDLDVLADFDPAAVQPLDAGVAMRVWQTRNPFNGLVYGYGGMKLIRTGALSRLDQADQATVDVLAALPGRVEFARQVAGTTRIDQSPYHAWKAGFREVAMLARGCEYGGTRDGERTGRIHAWTNPGQGEHAEWAAAGARDGLAFANATPASNVAAWDRLNDPAWLRRWFATRTAATPSRGTS
jgi:hypothetical protein